MDLSTFCKTNFPNKIDLEEKGEVFIINGKSAKVPLPIQKSRKRKRKRKRKNPKRKVKINTSEEGETLIVTQIVKVKKVKKPKIQCIINLSNICEKSKKKAKGKKLPKAHIDRVVPNCRRDKCFTCNSRSSLKNNVKKREEKRQLKISLETISSTSLTSKTDSDKKSSKMSYEDISSDSFSISDSELDILIKKTKDKNLCNPFDIKPPRFTSTPIHISSDSECAWLTSTSFGSEETLPESNGEIVTNKGSEKNASFHSAKTMILEVKPEAYSPTRPASDTSENKRFSPLIPQLLDLMENKNYMFTELTPVATFEGNECSDNITTEDFNSKNTASHYVKNPSKTENYFGLTDSVEQCFSNETTYDSEKNYNSSNIFSEKEEHLLQKAQSCEEKRKKGHEKFENYLNVTNTKYILSANIEEDEMPKKTQSRTKTNLVKIKEEYEDTDYSFNENANVTKMQENEFNIPNQNARDVINESHFNVTNKNGNLNEVDVNIKVKKEYVENENNVDDMSIQNEKMDVNVETNKEYVKTENHLDKHDDKAVKMDVNKNDKSCI